MGDDETSRKVALWEEVECVTGDNHGNVGSGSSGENAAAAGGDPSTGTGLGNIYLAADHQAGNVKSSFDSAVKRDALPGSLRSLRRAPLGISGRPRRVLRDPTDDSFGSDESIDADRRQHSGDSGGASSAFSRIADSDDRKKNASGDVEQLPKHAESGTETQSERKVLAEDSVHVSQSQTDSGEKSKNWQLSSSWKPINGLEELREELEALRMLNKQHRGRSDQVLTAAPTDGQCDLRGDGHEKPKALQVAPGKVDNMLEKGEPESREAGSERKHAPPAPSDQRSFHPKLEPLSMKDVVSEPLCDKRTQEDPCQQNCGRRCATHEEPLQKPEAIPVVRPRAPRDCLPKAEEVAAKPPEAVSRRSRDSSQFFTVNSKRYQRLAKIGSGGSSDVFKVISSDCTIYALKRISLKGRDHETAYNFYQEIEYLERLRGKQHIIQLIDYEVTDKYVFQQSKGSRSEIQSDVFILMVLEYGEVDLARMLDRKKKETSEGGRLDENWLRLYWEHILKAVSTIHELRIVHADLKPANFILVEGVLKLIDFGIAKAIQNDTTHIERESQMGTVNYMSPEAFMTSKDDNGTLRCGRASDIWSLGCILYQMVYGRTPFSHLSFYQKITVITNPRHEIDFAKISNPLILEVIKSCLRWDKSKRPRIPELLEHPFLRPRLVSEEHHFIKEAIVQSCKTYALLRGSLELAELVRMLLRCEQQQQQPHQEHEQQHQQHQQLDEALLRLCRLYTHKYGKTALHELFGVLL